MTKSLILSTMARASSSELISNTVTVGAMIETPRAAILAMEIAQQVDFLAFGTNDLTQMTFGLSRDDAGQTLIPTYRQLGLMEDDPFIVLDQEGVGEPRANRIPTSAVSTANYQARRLRRACKRSVVDRLLDQRWHLVPIVSAEPCPRSTACGGTGPPGSGLSQPRAP